MQLYASRISRGCDGDEAAKAAAAGSAESRAERRQGQLQGRGPVAGRVVVSPGSAVWWQSECTDVVGRGRRARLRRRAVRALSETAARDRDVLLGNPGRCHTGTEAEPSVQTLHCMGAAR